MSSARDVAPQRRAAYEVLRRVFEHEAWADRALPAAADRHGLDRRERAQAQRLAYGAVQRRGTSDYLIAELAERPLRKLDPPVLAALRLGLFFGTTPDFWMNLQVHYDLKLARRALGPETAERIAAQRVA